MKSTIENSFIESIVLGGFIINNFTWSCKRQTSQQTPTSRSSTSWLFSQEFTVQSPQLCVAFQINGFSYLVITHGGGKQYKPSDNTVYSFTPGFQLLQVMFLFGLVFFKIHTFIYVDRTLFHHCQMCSMGSLWARAQTASYLWQS